MCRRSLKTEEREPKASTGDEERSLADLVGRQRNTCSRRLEPPRGESRCRLGFRVTQSALLISKPLRWKKNLDGEFDPGSERTLAACLTHASRGRKPQGEYTGERVHNTWTTYLIDWDNWAKALLIPDKPTLSTGREGKVGLCTQADAMRWVRGPSASWRGNGPPRQRRVAGLRG